MENLEYQQKGIEILTNLVKKEKDPKKKYIKNGSFSSKGHYKTLKIFGRFQKKLYFRQIIN